MQNKTSINKYNAELNCLHNKKTFVHFLIFIASLFPHSRGWGWCLDDAPVKDRLSPALVLPGVLYSAVHQCRLQYGSGSLLCDEMDVRFTRTTLTQYKNARIFLFGPVHSNTSFCCFYFPSLQHLKQLFDHLEPPFPEPVFHVINLFMFELSWEYSLFHCPIFDLRSILQSLVEEHLLLMILFLLQAHPVVRAGRGLQVLHMFKLNAAVAILPRAIQLVYRVYPRSRPSEICLTTT